MCPKCVYSCTKSMSDQSVSSNQHFAYTLLAPKLEVCTQRAVLRRHAGLLCNADAGQHDAGAALGLIGRVCRTQHNVTSLSDCNDPACCVSMHKLLHMHSAVLQR